jgi:hypothetical protein
MYYNLICNLYALLCGQKFYSCKKWVLHLIRYRSGGTPNEVQPQGACELQGRRIEAPGLPALVLPVDAHRGV